MVRDVIKAIEDSEKVFSSIRQDDIDLDQDDWLEEAKKASLAFQKEIEPEISVLRDLLFETFINSDRENRLKIIGAISKTSGILNNLSIPLAQLRDAKNKDRAFEQALVLEVLLNLKPDFRDRLLYLHELVAMARTDNIPISSIIKKILPFTEECGQNDRYCLRKYPLNYV